MNNSICCICGKEYECCQDSMQVKSFTPWKTVVDNLNHYKIFLTIQQYTNKIITAKEAKNIFENQCDLSDKEAFKPEIITVINTIMKEGCNDSLTKINQSKIIGTISSSTKMR